MFERFLDQVVERLLRDREVRQLKKRLGVRFDDHVAYDVLDRGHRYCDSELLGLLYFYRYAPMHFAALDSILPRQESEALIEFGGGPGAGTLAVAERQVRPFDRLSLEHAEGMQRVSCWAASATNGRCSSNIECKFPDAHFWLLAENMTRQRRVTIVFSYFFAQKLSEPFVRALADRIQALPAASKNIVYTNPVGPTAHWMPSGGMHDWYRLFCRAMKHQPAIRHRTYSYATVKNLGERVRRGGECAADLWTCK